MFHDIVLHKYVCFTTLSYSTSFYIYVIGGWEVRIVKYCDRGLENAVRGRRLKGHFQALGHSFSLYGPTLNPPITYLSFFSCGKLANKWVCLRNFVISVKQTLEAARWRRRWPRGSEKRPPRLGTK